MLLAYVAGNCGNKAVPEMPRVFSIAQGMSSQTFFADDPRNCLDKSCDPLWCKKA